MRFNSLPEWLTWLESCHPSSEIELGLERIGQVAHHLNIVPSLDKVKVVTVAGTNGKGSCVAAINALLRNAGLHVGCYTSPHFIHYNERIIIDDKPITDDCLVAAFERVDQARASIELTYFEFGTLVALDVFRRQTLDVIVLEVGLGGRLDAVNIVDPDISIVTSIDLDHQDWLGTDRESIAREKAGIFRSGKPALCADPNPPIAIQSIADELGSVLFQRGREFDISPFEGKHHWRGVSATGSQVMTELTALTLPVGSIAAALQAVQLLDIPLQTQIDKQCLDSLVLPGRFQCIETNFANSYRQVILDVAHNPAAAQHLAEKLNCFPASGRTFALLAMMKDKDCRGVIEALNASIDYWFVTNLSDIPRAMSANELAGIINEYNIHRANVNQGIKQAYQHICSLMGPEDRLVVLGSFITVSEVMKLLQGSSASGGSV